MKTEIKITKNIPPELEQYIKAFCERTTFILFSIEDKLFELIEYDNCYRLKVNNEYLPMNIFDFEDVVSLIKEEINK